MPVFPDYYKKKVIQMLCCPCFQPRILKWPFAEAKIPEIKRQQAKIYLREK